MTVHAHTTEQAALQKFVKIALPVCGVFVLGVLALFLANNDQLLSERVGDFSQLGGDFSLRSPQGAVSLSDFSGKVVLLYFGYLSCPDVCPTSMSVIAKSLNQLPQDQMKQVQALLVTIDPARDDISALDKFTKHFHTNLLGLTSSIDTIKKVADQYGAYFDYLDEQNDDYLLEHVSRYYVIDQQGRLVDALRHGSSANEITARIQMLL